MEETITIDGKQFILMADAPLTTEYKEQAIAEIRKQSGCGCGAKTVNIAGIETMAGTCTRTSAFVGEVVTLRATGTGGTPPYTIAFVVGGTQIASFTTVPASTEKSTTYTTVHADTLVGSQAFVVTITDSCPGGSKSCSETCYIAVTECPIPVCNFTVT